MEHRDTPRVVPAEGRARDVRADPRDDAPRFARFVTIPKERRLVFRRLGLAILATMMAAIVLFVVGARVSEKLVRWLHGQPSYQTTFDAIVLEPPPPPWYRGGSALFLDRVRRSARRRDEPFSALAASLADLHREFRLYCWVDRVDRVWKAGPNGIHVRLDYRVPVALVSLPGTEERILLDEDAVILPLTDLDEDKAGILIRIVGPDAPFEPEAGHAWKSVDDTSHGVEKPHEGILAAAKLAAFLRSVLAGEARSIPPPLRRLAIHVRQSQGKSAIYVESAEETMIYWAEPPGIETPGQMTAEERWADLEDWVRRHKGPPIVAPSYLNFTKNGVAIEKWPGTRPK